ncbi:MAG: hypothetical protein WCI55_01680 [Armatimonadota bacterium]
MSARFTPKDIHPSIFEAVHDLTTTYMSGAADQRTTAAGTKHSSVWFAEYWKGTMIWLLGLIPVIGGAAMAADYGGKTLRVLTFLILLSAWLAAGYVGYQKNKKLITWEELEALRPGLNLSEHQTLYLDCLQYVEESRVLDLEQKKSWRDALFNALDQALVLDKLSTDMKTSSGVENHGESLAEIDRLKSLSSQSTDEVAKDAYNQSLEMAQDRMSKWDSFAVQAERTEAHMELTKQTFLKTRDTLNGLSLTQQEAVRVDLEPLRANLSRVQTDAHEIQRAIEELRQI